MCGFDFKKSAEKLQMVNWMNGIQLIISDFIVPRSLCKGKKFEDEILQILWTKIKPN